MKVKKVLDIANSTADVISSFLLLLFLLLSTTPKKDVTKLAQNLSLMNFSLFSNKSKKIKINNNSAVSRTFLHLLVLFAK